MINAAIRNESSNYQIIKLLNQKTLYSFPLPNTKLKFYQMFAYGILLLNTLGTVIMRAADKNILLQTATLFTVFIVMALWDVRNYKKNRNLLPIGILMIGYCVFWLRFGANLVFLANMILWLLYTISKRKMILIVSEENISYPSFPKKQLQWKDLNNVMLKDDILTIDCKNNKVYQHFIQHSEQYANEREFNDFCSAQLLK
jgi:hypothetical protein